MEGGRQARREGGCVGGGGGGACGQGHAASPVPQPPHHYARPTRPAPPSVPPPRTSGCDATPPRWVWRGRGLVVPRIPLGTAAPPQVPSLPLPCPPPAAPGGPSYSQIRRGGCGRSSGRASCGQPRCGGWRQVCPSRRLCGEGGLCTGARTALEGVENGGKRNEPGLTSEWRVARRLAAHGGRPPALCLGAPPPQGLTRHTALWGVQARAHVRPPTHHPPPIAETPTTMQHAACQRPCGTAQHSRGAARCAGPARCGGVATAGDSLRPRQSATPWAPWTAPGGGEVGAE